MKISDARVVITGATDGIGLEMAKALKALGAQIVISGRDAEKLTMRATELGVWATLADVTQEHQVVDLFKFAQQQMGNVNVLINNAGIGRFASLEETSVSEFQQIWEVNVKGLFLAGREAAKIFKSQNYGNIINIGSTASLRGYANGSAYVASKFAVSGLTECWRAELRPHNIRVMQINPSEVITDFISKAGFKVENEVNKLKPSDVADLAVSMLGMNDVAFIPDASLWATNPWS